MHLTFANLTLASSSFCSLEFDVVDPKIWPESTLPGPTAQRRRRREKERKGKGKGTRKRKRMGGRKERSKVSTRSLLNRGCILAFSQSGFGFGLNKKK